MADIPIWPGSASFSIGSSTAFGFYDNDSEFSTDAPNVANWCVQRLGYPLVDIELQDINLFTCFEEAVSEYGHQIYTFQIINNLFRIKGTSTGSALNQILIDSDYGNNLGSINQGGGMSYNITDARLYTASLGVKGGIQKYNLLSTSPGYASATITFNGTTLESQSIELATYEGQSSIYRAHIGNEITASANQFSTGSIAYGPTAISGAAASLKSAIENGSQKNNLSVSISASVLTVTQAIEGLGGNTSIIHDLSNVTTTNFIGGTSGLSFEASGSAIQAGDLGIKIKKIYHYAPSAINRYFDPYAGTGTGIQSLMQSFGFGNYSPGVNFMLMPIYFDILKLQAIEFNDQIRKSAYHFELNADRYLKLFPIPQSDYTLWFEYTMSDDSLSPSTDPTTGEEKPTNTITDISNAPYERPTYSYINEPGRQWIRKYTLALAKEMLGSVRGKYQTVPIPGSDTTLDYSRLLSEAATEKETLITQLREDLEATTTLKQAERSTAESQEQRAQYTVDNPYQIYIH